MITPKSIIADLDSALEEAGESITLRRTVGTQLIPFDVENIRAVLVGYEPEELVGEITQQDQKFILSPTEINRHQWPGFRTGTTTATDDRVPRKNDIIISSRGKLTVQAASGRYVQDVLVRIEGRVRGV